MIDEAVNEVIIIMFKNLTIKKTLIIEDTRGLHKGDMVKNGYRCF